MKRRSRPVLVCMVLAAAMAVSTASGRASIAPAPVAPVSIEFAAVVAGAPFQCGRSYQGIGTTRSTIDITELRLYVSNLRLVDAAGKEAAIALTQDGVWQQGAVALLDFEDGTGGCSNGTPETRRMVDGTAPAGGPFTGVRFDLGLPFDVNHRDPTLQPSPLNLTRMFWNWNGGYKFVRIDLKSTGQPQGCGVPHRQHRLHAAARADDRAVAVHQREPGADCDSGLRSGPAGGAVRSGGAAGEYERRRRHARHAGWLHGHADRSGLWRVLHRARPALRWRGASGRPAGVHGSRPRPPRGRSGASTLMAKMAAIARHRSRVLCLAAAGWCTTLVLAAAPQTSPPEVSSDYVWDLPTGFPMPKVPADNPMSIAKVALGRRLFYDRRLSSDGTFSCATCHDQERAFTDGKARPAGVTGERHPRSSMSLANIVYTPVLDVGQPHGAATRGASAAAALRRASGRARAGGARCEDAGEPGGRAGIPRRVCARVSGTGRSDHAAQPGGRDRLVRAHADLGPLALRPLPQRENPNAISASARRGEELFFSTNGRECFHCHGGFNFTETVDYRRQGRSPRSSSSTPASTTSTGRAATRPTNTGRARASPASPRTWAASRRRRCATSP